MVIVIIHFSLFTEKKIENDVPHPKKDFKGKIELSH